MDVPADGEAVNGDAAKGVPPPPSPLTGCYLLLVIGEPHSDEHKEIILRRIAKGLLSWDIENCHVDLEKELQTINNIAPEGEETRHGERLIQFASENLVTEVLIHPATNTLIQCIKNLLSSFTRHRHIIHSGYTFSGNGSWALQDGTFSYSDFSEAFQEIEVQRVLRAYDNTITVDVHCSPEGDWTRLPKESYAKNCKVRVNPDDVLASGSPAINGFLDFISPYLLPADIESLLESSDVVGNIRFSHPTLYVFPGGQGDAALFGINGFNMLVDGGYARKACFWDFTRHLDRLDAVLVTRLNNSNVCGVSSVLRRKTNNQVYPQIGHFFCNIQERKAISPDGDKDKDLLLINLLEEGHEIVLNLRQLNLRPQPCYRDPEPVNLYHKVGHGTLDMYVLSPAKDSKEVKEFMHKWNTNDHKLFSTRKDPKEFSFPLQNLVSVCALLVWQPANPSDTITRLLFPGSTPQHKIFEGLDRLKHLEFMKHPVCSAKTLTPSGSITGLTKVRQIKASTVLDKILPPQKIDNKPVKEKSPPQTENKQKENKIMAENKNKIEVNGTTPEENKTQPAEKVIKSDSIESEKIEQVPEIKKSDNINGKDIEITPIIIENEKDTKSKPKLTDAKQNKPKPQAKPRSESAARKSVERKPTKPSIEKKPETKPSPTTPKKTADTKVNGVSKEKEVPKPKSMIKMGATKASPTSTPAKSTKDANNRKVVESKKFPLKKEPAKVPEKKELIKTERKPISRRPKASSPARAAKLPGSPTKKAGIKIDKNGVSRTIRLEKEGTTDSSAVSTPSADQEKKIDETKLTKTELEELKAKELADLKEEQEVVKEIEAVFRKDEKMNGTEQPDLRKIKDMSLEEKTTEPEDEEEEYLIIEKEEVEQYTDSVNEQESGTKGEDEIQKHLRDSEESEKRRKSSDAEKVTEDEQKDVTGKTLDDEIITKVDAKVDKTSDEPKEAEHEPYVIPPEMIRSKEDSKDKTEDMSKEISVTSPEDKIDMSSEKKTTDTKDVDEEEIKEPGDQNYVLESQPDEKFSATIESGATTAPTLPEDERITLDEIKEDQADQVIEEKYVKEETKEKEIPIVILPQKTFESIPKINPIVGMKFETHQTHIRDIVKTPDEVADLPVHEEVDVDIYDFPGTFKKDEGKKEIVKSKEEINKLAEKTEEIVEAVIKKPVTEKTDEPKPSDVKVEKIDDEIQKPETSIKESQIIKEKVPVPESETKIEHKIVDDKLVKEIVDDKHDINVEPDKITDDIGSKVIAKDTIEPDESKKVDKESELVTSEPEIVKYEDKLDNIKENVIEKITQDKLVEESIKSIEKDIVKVEHQTKEEVDKIKEEIVPEKTEKEIEKLIDEHSEFVPRKTDEIKTQVTSATKEEEKISTAEEKVNKIIDELKEEMICMKDKSDKLDEIKRKFEAPIDKIEHTEIIDNLKDELEIVTGKISDETDISAKVDEVKDEIQTLAEKVPEKVNEIIAKITDKADDTETKVESITDKTPEEIQTHVEEKEKVIEKTADALVAVGSSIEKLPEKIEEAIDDAKEKVDEAKADSSKYTEELKEKVETTIDDIKSKINEETTKISEKSKDLKDEVTSIVEEKSQKILLEAEAAVEIASEKITTISDKKDNLKDKIEGVLVEKTSELANLVDDEKDKIEHAVDKIPEKIETLLDDAKDTIEEKATEITDKTTDIKETVESAAEKLKDDVKDEVIKKTTEITDKAGEVIQEIESSAEKIPDTLDKIVDEISDKIIDSKETVHDALEKIQERAEEIVDVKGQIIDKITDLADKTEDLKEAVQCTVEKLPEKIEKIVDDTKKEVVDKTTEIADKTEDLNEAVQSTIEKLPEKIEKVVDDSKIDAVDKTTEIDDKTEDLKDSVQSIVEEQPGKIEKIVDNSKKDVVDITTKIADKTEDLKETAQTTIEKLPEKIENIIHESKKDFVEKSTEITDKINDLKETVQSTVEKIPEKIETIEESLQTTVEKQPEKIEKFIDDSKNKIIEKTTEVADKTEDFDHQIQKAIEIIPEKLEKLADNMKEKVLPTTKISEKTEDLDEKILGSLKELPEKVDNIVADAKDKVVDKITEVAEDTKKLKESVPLVTASELDEEVVSDVKDIIVKKTADIAENVENIKEETNSAVAEKTEKIAEDTVEKIVQKSTELSDKAEDIKEIVHIGIDKLPAKVETVIDDAKEEILEKSKATVDNANEVKDEMEISTGKISVEVEKIVEDKKDKIDEQFVKIDEKTGDLQDKIVSMGEKLDENIDNIKDKVMSAVEKIPEKLEETIDDANEKLTKVIEKSPEKEEKTIHYVKESTDDKTKAVSDKIVAIKDEIECAVEKIPEKIEKIIDDAKEKPKEIISQISEKVKEVSDDVKDTVVDGIAKTVKVFDEIIEDTQEEKDKMEKGLISKIESIKKGVDDLEDTHKKEVISKIGEEEIKISALSADKEEVIEKVSDKHVEIKPEMSVSISTTDKSLEQEIEEIAEKVIEETVEKVSEKMVLQKEIIPQDTEKHKENISDKSDSNIEGVLTKSVIDNLDSKIEDTCNKIDKEIIDGTNILSESVIETKDLTKAVITDAKENLSDKTEKSEDSKTVERIKESIDTIICPADEKDVDKLPEDIVIELDRKDDKESQKEQIKEQKEQEEIKEVSSDDAKKSKEPVLDENKLDEIRDGLLDDPKREEVIAKIVTNVAQVLKSDASLEELAPTLPLEFTAPFSPFGLKGYTTELRETHITTVDSPLREETPVIQKEEPLKETKIVTEVCTKSFTSSFLDEERRQASIDKEFEVLPAKDESSKSERKISDLIKDSNDLIESSSKIISEIKGSKEEDVESKKDESKPNMDIETYEDDETKESGTVHRMLVTASSEDGGEETIICPAGSITFVRTESSGNLSPDHGVPSSPHELLSGRSTPEKTEKDMIEKENMDKDEKDDTRGSSGKSSPDLHSKDDSKPKEKICDDSYTTVTDIKHSSSGKTTPDLHDDKLSLSAVSTPERRSSITSQKIYGKLSPELQDFTDSHIQDTECKEAPQKESVAEILEKPENKQVEQSSSLTEVLATTISGQPEQSKQLPTHEDNTKSDEKISPDEKIEVRKDSVTSVKSDVSQKSDSKITPDPQDFKDLTAKSPEPTLRTKNELVEQAEDKKLTEISTKQEIDHKDDSLALQKTDDLSGKSSPDSKIEKKSEDQLTLEKNELEGVSGKSTPDIKSTSGKSSPDLKSTISTPEGKLSPDLRNKSVATTPDRKDSLESGVHVLSGKTSPDIKEKVVFKPEKDVSFDKSTTELNVIKGDEINVKDESLGKISSDVREEIKSFENDDTSKEDKHDDKPECEKQGKPSDIKLEITDPSCDLKPDISKPDDLSKINIADLKDTTLVDKIEEFYVKSELSIKDNTPQCKASPETADDKSVASEKSTPESKSEPTVEFVLKQTAKPGELSEKGLITSVEEFVEDTISDTKKGSSTMKSKIVEEIDSTTKESIEVSSDIRTGKSSPETQTSEIIVETKTKQISDIEDHDKFTDINEKSSKTSSGKATPEPRDKTKIESLEEVEKTNEITLSEKSPLEKSVTADLTELSSKSLTDSGRSSPLDTKHVIDSAENKLLPTSDIESGKSTPDLKHEDKLDKKDTDDIKQQSSISTPHISGKTTPDIQEKLTTKSEKSPEKAESVKSEHVSREHSPDKPLTCDLSHISQLKDLETKLQDTKPDPGIKDITEDRVSSDVLCHKASDTVPEVESINEKMDIKSGEINITTTPVLQPIIITDSSSSYESSKAGPSHSPKEGSKPSSEQLSPTVKDTHLSTEDLHLSGKSTPDIADVERMKEIHEILKHEKHIPGSSTPPTVPVSPIVKESFSSLTETKEKKECDTKESEIMSDISEKSSEMHASEESIKDSHKDVTKEATVSLTELKTDSKTSSSSKATTEMENQEEVKEEIIFKTVVKKDKTYSEIKEPKDDVIEETVPSKFDATLTTTLQKTDVSDEESDVKVEFKMMKTDDKSESKSVKINEKTEKTEVADKKHEATEEPADIEPIFEKCHIKTDISKKDVISKKDDKAALNEKTIVTSKTEITETITTTLTTKTSEIRCPTPGSDDYELGGVSSPHSDISSGQMSRVPHAWGQESSEERHTYSDDEVPDSPMSVTSQMAHSPQSHFGESEFETHTETITHKITKIDPMNVSLYGTLPDDPIDTSQSVKTTSKSDEHDKPKCEPFTSEKRFLDEADLDFEKAMIEHRQTRGSDLVGTSSESNNYKYEITTAKYYKSTAQGTSFTNGTQKDERDTLEATGAIKKESSKGSPGKESSQTVKEKDPLETWGKPLGLPSPALPPTNEISNKTTPKKMPPSATLAAKNKINDERKRSDSPLKYDKKNKKMSPVYMDLTYVPHHGNSNYSFVDFFKRVRARYYVFSGTEPSRDVYNALLEAKQTWEDKDLEVTIIPTYDTDVLGYWVAENEDLLAKYKIDLSPSASRCTINLQDHETSCSAYRLEF